MKQTNIYAKFNYLLTYLFLLFFRNIKADCTSGCKIENKICTHNSNFLETCDSYCIPNLIDGKCYSGAGISASDYYYFSDINNVITNDCTNKKIIFNTKQCVEQCISNNNLYELGDYCYTKEDCEKGNRQFIEEESKCECKYLKSINDGLYHCYGEGEKCGSEHTKYDFTSKICGECNYESMKKKKIEHRDRQSDIIRCSDNCESDEFLTNDNYCLDENECPVNYYKYTDDNGQKHCVDRCAEGFPYILDGNICNKTCYGYIYDDNSCKVDCPSPYYITDISENEKYCSFRCNKVDLYIFINTIERKCVVNCPDNRYKKDNICTTDTDCYIKNTDVNKNNIECFSNCEESGMPYYDNGIPKICYDSCSSGKFHYEGEFECFSNCNKNNNVDSDSYYLEGNVCYCKLYAIENEIKVCYKDEEACYNEDYKFLKGRECLKTCNPYFEVVDNVGSQNYLRKCYYSVDECKSYNYYYYNTYKLTCWSTCPENMFSNEIDNDGKPKEDKSRSTCVDQCSQDFPKHTYGINICKKECDNGEYYTLEEPNTCISFCNDTYPYIGENNECLKTCENKKFYFEIGNNKKKCVSSCSAYGKFYIDDNPKCFDDCKEVSMYFYNSDKKCLTNCLYDKNEQFSYTKDENNPQPCKADNDGKYYFDDKILVDSCSPYFISEKGSYLCVEHCGYTKKVYENYCIDNCPEEAPYFEYDQNHNHYKCVDKCQNSQYVIIFRKECVNSCPTGYSKNETFKICYPNCKFGEKYDFSSGECKASCAQYYEKTTYYGSEPIYICSPSCIGKNKFIKDINDKECVEQCPTNNNFIQKNSNQCVTKCQKDDFFIEATIDGIYQCLDSCPTDQGYFYVFENEEIKRKCYKGCPTDFNFVADNTQNKFICFSRCPSTHPFYIAADKGDKSYYTCLEANPCLGSNSYYFEGKCRTGTECKTDCDKLYVENKICVEECSNDNKYKKFEDPIFKCQSFCDSNDFIDSENKCIDKCPEKENYINDDKYCFAQCNNNEYYYYPVQENYPIYKCSEFCPQEDYTLEVYNSKKCVRNCPNSPKQMYLSENEKKCYFSCLDSTDYKYTLKEENKCLSSCNKDNPYYYDQEKICLKKCNSGDYAYAISDNYYIFKCIDSCNILTGYYTYTKSASTDQSMFCYRQCPSDKLYAHNDICVPQCPQEKKFFVKEYKHYGDDLQKKCLTDCPKEYPYYTIDDDENGNKGYGCLNSCDEGYKVINYSDPEISATLCIKDCPDKDSKYKNEYQNYKYKIIDKNNKKCYSICPPEKPYYKNLNIDKYKDDNNCYESCPDEAPFSEMNQFICKTEDECIGEYIDYETKKCLPIEQIECPTDRKYKSKYNGKTICLDRCIDKYGKYLSPYDTCVNDCINDFVGYGLINDPKNDKCICKHLYIINDQLQMECLTNSTSELKCKNVSQYYSIKMFNSKECVKTCNNSNILSASEDICYNASHICGESDLENDRNTGLIIKKMGKKNVIAYINFILKMMKNMVEKRKYA